MLHVLSCACDAQFIMLYVVCCVLCVNREGLLTFGWIHTHPTQTCFLSSIDMHTQFSYQIMMPEAIAIVMAPSKEPNSGVFTLTPKGMDILSVSQFLLLVDGLCDD